jgi:hypothetical protein
MILTKTGKRANEAVDVPRAFDVNAQSEIARNG